MRTLTMEDKLAIILGSIGTVLGGFAGIYQWIVRDRENKTNEADLYSDNRREDFKVLIDEFRSQNTILKERVNQLDEKLQQYESQLRIQNRHIKKLGDMLQKAITVIEDLGANPKEHGIIDITEEQ